MERTVIFLVLLFFSTSLYCAEFKGIEYTIEPIYGYQKIELISPYKRIVGKYFYGARISGGYKMFNLEGMYTKSEVDEVFTSSGEVTRDIIEKLSLGFSTSYSFNNWSLALLRFGGVAKRIEHHSIINEITTISNTADEYSPYIGLGAEVYFKKYIALTLGATVILNGLPDSYSDNEYEYTSGMKVLY